MSDGKYLINKSSLTGIADAVRDKLGAGEATTDPQTGDIVYPKGKGYYIDSVTTMFIEVPDNNAYSISPGAQIKEFIRCPKSAYLTKVEKPVSEIEVEGIFGATVTGRRFKRYIVINSNSFQLDDQNLTNIQNFKQTFDTPKTYLSISISVTNDYATTQSISWSNVKIYLRDENGNLIDLITSGFPSNGCTIGTTTSQIQKPIPYSISDITNNIEDYWSVPEGSLNISANGTYDVTNKAEAVVNVPNPSTGSLEITENGTYDVTDKASAVVNVPTGGGGGGTAERWWATKFNAGNGPYTLPTYLDTFEKFSTQIRAVQITNKLGAVLFKTDGTLCSYKDLNMDAPTVAYNAISNSISNQDVIDAYNDDRIFAMNTYDNDRRFYMGFKDNQIFFGYDYGNLGDNVGSVVLYYVYKEA